MPGFTNAERLAIYTHLRMYESDFDKSQSQIRALCAAWSAAVVGAIAVIVTSANTPAGIPLEQIGPRADVLALLRSIVCIIGSAGVFAFWYVDQRIYQRLLHTVFAYGLLIEAQNGDLPQIRSALFVANSDITKGLAWFYRVQFFAFFVVTLVFVLQPFSMKLGPTPSGMVSLAVVHAALVVSGQLFSMGWPSLRSIIKKTYPQLAGEIPDFGKLCEASSLDDLRKRKSWRKRICDSLLLEQQAVPAASKWTARVKSSQGVWPDVTEFEIEEEPRA